MPLTGIYGEPLETVKAWLQALAAFGSFSPSGDVYLIERIGSGTDPVAGDAWACLTYPEDQVRLVLVPGLEVSRVVELSLVRCVALFTEAAKEALVNDVSAIVQGLRELDAAAGILSEVRLKQFAVDEAAEPPRLGAILWLNLDLGGR